jgi:uncharacterized protein YkwD
MSLLHPYWVDLIIILILIFFIHQGFVNGFWSILIDFVAFFGALLISFQTSPTISAFIISHSNLTKNITNALGFLISAVLIELIISFILNILISKLPPKILKNHFTRILGIILSVGQGVILIAFVITLAISLPISPAIKTDIASSRIGKIILDKTTGIEKNINIILGPGINESLTYITIEPKSHESIPLNNTSLDLSVDRPSETKMFDLVNQERTSRNIHALVWNVNLVVVAENYGRFMWANHYFGHYDPAGKDVGDRLNSANISFQIAGENLALAPTVGIAHTGLMNSPGHKANILEAKFNKVGIGVIDNLYYGKIFVQVFTD